jgi:hypothetical protein
VADSNRIYDLAATAHAMQGDRHQHTTIYLHHYSMHTICYGLPQNDTATPGMRLHDRLQLHTP